ncbi:MAG: hypothetical protein ABIH35_00965 [Patescibacteria group bacterium]
MTETTSENPDQRAEELEAAKERYGKLLSSVLEKLNNPEVWKEIKKAFPDLLKEYESREDAPRELFFYCILNVQESTSTAFNLTKKEVEVLHVYLSGYLEELEELEKDTKEKTEEILSGSDQTE